MLQYTIYPYVSNWGGERVWVFDDPDVGLINEGLVSGTDLILDRLAARFKDGEQGFKLIFSDEEFAGHELKFEWLKSGSGEGLADGVDGNWYTEKATGYSGWLCPALLKYFDEAPKFIFVKAEALAGKLEHGTGKVIIQGKKDQS